MIKADQYFKENLNYILNWGYVDENPRPQYRDGTPAHTYYITQIFEKYDISAGEFPITTLKNTAIKTGIQEILWIYQDQSNSLTDAHRRQIAWWTPWQVGDHTIGTRYGYTVNKWNLIDNLLNGLINNPFGRRHIMNLYQEADLQEGDGLYPCAYETEWAVRKVNGVYYLDCFLNQRSNDYLMAGYINKIQYVALQMMIAEHCGYRVGKFAHYINNLHIYDRHLNGANEVLYKEPLNQQPKIELKCNKNFYDFNVDDFKIHGKKNITDIESELEIAI